MRGRKLLKTIVLIDFVIVVYVILTSTIISVSSENKARSIIVDSILHWSTKSFDTYNYIVQREKEKFTAADNELAKRLRGKTLLQVDSRGEAWYVFPGDQKKYFLGKPLEAYQVIQKLSTEISNDDLVQYMYFDRQFPEHLAGRIVTDISDKKMYYIDPEGKNSYLLPSPEEALQTMTEHGLGITNANIRKIIVGDFDF